MATATAYVQNVVQTDDACRLGQQVLAPTRNLRVPKDRTYVPVARSHFHGSLELSNPLGPECGLSRTIGHLSGRVVSPAPNAVVATKGAGESRCRAGDQRRQGLAKNEVHDQRDLSLMLHDVNDGHDVGVTNPRCEFGFVEEARGEVRILGEVRMQALDRDGSRKSAGAEQAADVHGGHPA